MSDPRQGTAEDLEELGPELLQPDAPEPQAPPQALEPFHFRGGTQRPVLGPALTIFGVWVWAYAVVGQLVVALEFPEALGFLGLLAAIGAAYYLAVERSFQVDWPSAVTR